MSLIRPIVTSFKHAQSWTATHIVQCPNTKKCLIIDVATDYTASSGVYGYKYAQSIVDHVKKEGLDTKFILETHAHADHISAAPFLKESLGGSIGIGSHITEVQEVFSKKFHANDFKCDGSQFDFLIEDDQIFSCGDLVCKAFRTPGHTPACMTFSIGDALFIGDTLFSEDIGTARCDFPGGSAELLFDSIQKIYEYPDEYRIFLGHDYPGGKDREYKFETTVGSQKTTNKMLNAKTTKEEYVLARTTRDSGLSVPALLFPSLQFNIRAGNPPAPLDDGVSYLNIPLTRE